MGCKVNSGKRIVFILFGILVTFVCGVFVGGKITTTKSLGALVCSDGAEPDSDGCCSGEIYTDMGDYGYNCCPLGGTDCFPPIKISDK